MVKLGRGFREFPPNSINGICAIEETFMKLWGDTKYYLYYITKFGALKRKLSESMEYFRKYSTRCIAKFLLRLNPHKHIPSHFSNAFNAYFSLLLRERRVVTLANMQEASMKVDSNLKEANRLRDKLQYQ